MCVYAYVLQMDLVPPPLLLLWCVCIDVCMITYSCLYVNVCVCVCLWIHTRKDLSPSLSLSLSHHGQRGRHSYELSDIQARLLIHDFPADKRPTQVVLIRHRYYAGK